MATKSSPAGEHLPFLDVLRGIAILLVFGYHCVGAALGPDHDTLPWNGLFRNFDISRTALAVMPLYLGWVGVTLFFVISGFCIHLSHQRARDKGLDVFFLRRFFRIYPPFLVALLAFAACRLNFLHHFWASAKELGIHLILLNNYLPTMGNINGAFWSIATEAQLYLLYPILLVIAAAYSWRKTMWVTGALLALILTGEPLLAAFAPGFVIPFHLNLSPLYNWYIWSAGAALADAWLKKEPLPFRKIPFYVWLVAGVASWFYRPVAPLCPTLLGLACAALVALCLDRPETFSAARLGALWKPLTQVGLCSYSCYLLHVPILKILLLVALKVIHHPVPNSVAFLLAVSTFAIIFPIAWFFYRWVELPSIELGKWAIQKRKNAHGASADASTPVPSAEA